MSRSARKSVFVGMSGGVDSSVAAYLLKEQGYDTVGVFLRCYNLDGCSEQDALDARRAAEHLGIPFYVWDFEEEYKRAVVDYMIEAYRSGVTPNPDVMCNREIKFGLFYRKALDAGADFVATGHYARIVRQKNRPAELLAAADQNKDQSYFLWTLTQEHLRRCLFPIGPYLKSEVREIAARAGLPNAAKKDSQGICFLGKISIAEFLKERIGATTGPVVTAEGTVVGKHDGAHLYTVGQRHGLSLGSTQAALRSSGSKPARPFYVAGKDVNANTVIVAQGDDHPALFRREASVVQEHWIAGKPPEFPASVFARLRYRQPLAAARIVRNGRTLTLAFGLPQKFVSPGQSAVWYEKTKRGFSMLGGGVIV